MPRAEKNKRNKTYDAQKKLPTESDYGKNFISEVVLIHIIKKLKPNDIQATVLHQPNFQKYFPILAKLDEI